MTAPSSPFLSDRDPVCPADLLLKAQAVAPPRVAIARAGAALPMQAAKAGVEAGIMVPVFVGEAAQIHAAAEKISWDIAGFALHETKGEAEAADVAATLCGAGRADVLMKGQLHSDIFIRAALKRDAGLRSSGRLVHIFHISPAGGGRPLLISDAAVKVAPSVEARKFATQLMVDLLHCLGNARPKIAFLSATESILASVPSSGEAEALAHWAQAHIQDADFSGPLALDLILSSAAVAVKQRQDDLVAGRADGVIVPDIVSGNTLFKALVYLAGGCAAGIVLGAKVPLLLTSRADPAAARLASIALAAIVVAANPQNG